MTTTQPAPKFTTCLWGSNGGLSLRQVQQAHALRRLLNEHSQTIAADPFPFIEKEISRLFPGILWLTMTFVKWLDFNTPVWVSHPRPMRTYLLWIDREGENPMKITITGIARSVLSSDFAGVLL